VAVSRTGELLAAVDGRKQSVKGWLRANCFNVHYGKWPCFRCGERGRIKSELLGLPLPRREEPDS